MSQRELFMKPAGLSLKQLELFLLPTVMFLKPVKFSLKGQCLEVFNLQFFLLINIFQAC
jgi:hypothetical protein